MNLRGIAKFLQNIALYYYDVSDGNLICMLLLYILLSIHYYYYLILLSNIIFVLKQAKDMIGSKLDLRHILMATI